MSCSRPVSIINLLSTKLPVPKRTKPTYPNHCLTGGDIGQLLQRGARRHDVLGLQDGDKEEKGLDR